MRLMVRPHHTARLPLLVASALLVSLLLLFGAGVAAGRRSVPDVTLDELLEELRSTAPLARRLACRARSRSLSRRSALESMTRTPPGFQTRHLRLRCTSMTTRGAVAEVGTTPSALILWPRAAVALVPARVGATSAAGEGELARVEAEKEAEEEGEDEEEEEE